MTTNTHTFAIVLHNRASVDRSLAAIAKRAARKGLPVPTWTWGATSTAKEEHAFRHEEYPEMIVTREVRVTRIELALSAEPVRFAGWTFVAALTHLDSGTIVRAMPGVECPVEYRGASGACDHCRALRRRKETYVLRHEDGRHTQVGSTCIDDFLGGEGAADAAMRASIVGDLRRVAEMGWSDMSGYGRSGDVGLVEYLTIVAALVRVDGWVSRTVAREQGGAATADRAQDPKVIKRLEDERLVIEADGETAAAALAWGAELTDEEVERASGDYLHNVRAIARAGYVEPKLLGIGASIVTAYQRAIGAMRARAEREARPKADVHVGEIGAKVSFGVPVKVNRRTGAPLKGQPVSLSAEPVVLDLVTGYQTDYGYTTVLKFRTAEGAVLVWKSSGAGAERDDVGKRYALTGTVKSHGDYKGEKQTNLTRCTMVEVEAEAAAASAVA